MTFPLINHLDDVLPHIKDHPEFVLTHKDGYSVIDYVYWRNGDTFSHEMRRECRGIKFAPDGTILARSFHKFFNVGEPNALPVDWSSETLILDKLDGSMIHPAYVNGEIRFMTRAGITDPAKMAESLFMETHHSFCEYCLKYGFTPIFEFIGPANPHVVSYPENQLILLAIRYNILGQYVENEACYDTAREFMIPYVLSSTFNDNKTLDDVVATTKALIDTEGFVLRTSTGWWKIKADMYVLRHKAKDKIRDVEWMVEQIVDDNLDDLYPVLTEEQITYANELRKKVLGKIESYNLIVPVFTNSARTMPRKDYALNIVQNIEAPFRCVFFAALDGKDWEAVLKQAVKKNAKMLFL